MSQALAKPPGKELGFGDGLRALFGGVRWIIGTPSAWGLAMVPAVIALLLLVLISWGIFSLGSHLFGGRIDGALEPGVGSSVVRVVANVLWFVVSVVIGFVLSLSLALPLSAPALDAIAKKRARELGMTQFVETSIVASAWRSLRVVSMALLVGLPVILLLSIVTMVFPPRGRHYVAAQVRRRGVARDVGRLRLRVRPGVARRARAIRVAFSARNRGLCVRSRARGGGPRARSRPVCIADGGGGVDRALDTRKKSLSARPQARVHRCAIA